MVVERRRGRVGPRVVLAVCSMVAGEGAVNGLWVDQIGRARWITAGERCVRAVGPKMEWAESSQTSAAVFRLTYSCISS